MNGRFTGLACCHGSHLEQAHSGRTLFMFDCCVDPAAIVNIRLSSIMGNL